MHTNDTIPYGFCMCGCGNKTSLSRQTDTKRGYVRGKPVSYLPGHWQRGRKKPGPEYIINGETGCWEWQRKITHGYAYITIDRRVFRAARYFFEKHVGPIPDGYTIDHLCRNRACVNPKHLEAVTLTENVRRKPSTKLMLDSANRIRELASCMKQDELAAMFGVSQSTISRVLSGEAWR